MKSELNEVLKRLEENREQLFSLYTRSKIEKNKEKLLGMHLDHLKLIGQIEQLLGGVK